MTDRSARSRPDLLRILNVSARHRFSWRPRRPGAPARSLVLGALFFTFQIYCDFSGYSDMAIGIARLFNINLMQNFAFPYFSRNIRSEERRVGKECRSRW